MSKITLSDDGTLDTVLLCTECNENFRFNYANTFECSDDDSDVPTYDDWIDEIIDETESEHVCFGYYINLDERGEFSADVRREYDQKTVFEINGFDIFQDGFMKHKDDLCGLKEYLDSLGVISLDSTLEKMN